MIETVENIEGVLQEQASLSGDIVDGGSIKGNLDSVGNIMKEKDVNFYDYDGSLVYSYTADEFLNMYAFPPNPRHRGLISEGWNWSLENAREYVSNYGKLDLGQLYNVEGDGAIIGITLTDADLRASWNQDCDYGQYDPETGTWGDDIYYYSYIMQLYLPLEEESEDKYLIVDWGDGSTDTWYGRDEYDDNHIYHIYNNIGDYEIKITPINGAIFCVEPAHDYCEEVIKYVHLGRNEKQIVDTSGDYPYSGTYFFKNCSKLEYITTLDIYYSLSNCYNLKTIIYSRNEEQVNINFTYMYGLTNLILSDTMNYIYITNDSNIRQNNIKNIFIPKTWKVISIIIKRGDINNIIIPDTQPTNSDEYFINLSLYNNNIKYIKLPTIIYPANYMTYGNGISFIESVVHSGITLPININSDNLSTLAIEHTFAKEYLYLPPGITKFGYNDLYPNYYYYAIFNGPAVEDDSKVKSFKVIDCRNHTQVPVLGLADAYFYDYALRYLIVPDDLIDEWKNATNWSVFSDRFITASDYDNIQRRPEE